MTPNNHHPACKDQYFVIANAHFNSILILIKHPPSFKGHCTLSKQWLLKTGLTLFHSDSDKKPSFISVNSFVNQKHVRKLSHFTFKKSLAERILLQMIQRGCWQYCSLMLVHSSNKTRIAIFNFRFFCGIV